MARPRTSRTHALGFIGLVVGMLATASGGSAVGMDLTQTPGLTLSRSSGPPTTRISISGTGFAAGETVDLAFDGTELATVDADAGGGFTGARLRVPDSAKPRTHTVSAVGRTSSLSAEASFLVRTDWPQYRGGPARIGFNRYENVLSVASVDRLELVWTFDTGDEVYASPTVVDGVVYSGSGFTGSGAGEVYALDAAGGDLVWSATFGTEAPAVRGGVTYGVHNDVSALDAATGEPIWSYAGGEEGFRSGVALVRDVVYAVAPRGEIVALDASDGTLLWSRSIHEDLWATPSVAGGSVVVGTVSHRVYSLDASTGDVRWRIRVPNYIISSAAVVRGVIYIGVAEEGLYALDAKTGELIWRTERAAGTTPAAAGGLVYVGTGYGDIDAYDVSTGDLVWRFHAGGGDVDSSPTVANGVVYVGSNGDTIYALDARTGEELWSHRTGLGIKSSPTVVDGMLYVGSKDGKIYAFGLR